MSSKKRAFNKRIRETITRLPDDALVDIVKNSPRDYTPYALQVARGELSKRKQMEVLHKEIGALRKTNEDKSEAAQPYPDSSDCFIELWRDKNFAGDHLLIEGPVECETLNSATEKWGDDISSLRVGPNAFVIAYERDSFRGEMICFGPCQEVADLSVYEFNDEIDSMKLINSVKVFEYVRHGG
jgi:hypothetical protein